MSERWRESLRSDAAQLTERTAESILQIAGPEWFDALEGAFLARDRPALGRSEDREWTLAMCFSSTVMFGLHDQIAIQKVGERHAVDGSLDRAVRLLLLDAVNELRALVRSGDREDLLSLIDSAERYRDSRSGHQFDTLLSIFAGYELEESEDARRLSGT